jgi:chromosome segregation ATPase
MKDDFDKIMEAVTGIGRDCLDSLKALSGRVQVQRMDIDELAESLKATQGVVQTVSNEAQVHHLEISDISETLMPIADRLARLGVAIEKAAEKLSAIDERVTFLEQQCRGTAGDKGASQ